MSAIISSCGLFRYRLERLVGQVPLLELGPAGVFELRGKTVGFFGVNPSRADAQINDHTVTKWIGFCHTWGAPRFIVGNVSALRATDVRELAHARIPADVEASNWQHLAQIIADADILVPCWGDRKKVPALMHDDMDRLMAMLEKAGKPVITFGLTKGGDPKHPLMLGYSTQLAPWRWIAA